MPHFHDSSFSDFYGLTMIVKMDTLLANKTMLMAELKNGCCFWNRRQKKQNQESL
jgi:hypothetical protein